LSRSFGSATRPASLCVKSGYHDLPYGILVYPPEKEFELRRELTLLRTRLHQAGKHVTTISLAECMTTALAAEGLGAAELARGRARLKPAARHRDRVRGPLQLPAPG
jgi:hypothetical protein